MSRIYLILLILLVGCYNDDDQLVSSENIAHNTSELTLMLKSMSLHNASFDDQIDNTSCLSLVFPYQIYVNSNLKTISSMDDIFDLNNDDNIEIVYPVNSTFFNYEEHQALDQTEFNLVKNTCDLDFNIESNHCLNIQFPIIVKEFNDLTESFDSYPLYNDKEVYLHFDNLHDSDVYELDYPIFLSDVNSDLIRIESNEEFIEAFNISHGSCD